MLVTPFRVLMYLSIIRKLATTLPIPNQMVGHTYPGTVYFITSTTALPARPPASNAKPRNRTSFAFHATPLPLYEKLSALSLVLSIKLMTSMPSALQIPGIQSTKVMWTAGSEAFMADLDHTAMSIRV